MKKSILLVMFGTVVFASPFTISADSPTSGMMLKPDEVSWVPNPRVVGLEVARVQGHAQKSGQFIHRVKFPKGRIVQAHSHPDDRTYTVLSGTWYIGWGKVYDPDKLIALPAGSFYTEPAGVPHFVSTPDGEAIVQITGTGPTAVDYVDSSHARKKISKSN